jgi:hypothetical protein
MDKHLKNLHIFLDFTKSYFNTSLFSGKVLFVVFVYINLWIFSYGFSLLTRFFLVEESPRVFSNAFWLVVLSFIFAIFLQVSSFYFPVYLKNSFNWKIFYLIILHLSIMLLHFWIFKTLFLFLENF